MFVRVSFLFPMLLVVWSSSDKYLMMITLWTLRVVFVDFYSVGHRWALLTTNDANLTDTLHQPNQLLTSLIIFLLQADGIGVCDGRRHSCLRWNGRRWFLHGRTERCSWPGTVQLFDGGEHANGRERPREFAFRSESSRVMTCAMSAKTDTTHTHICM